MLISCLNWLAFDIFKIFMLLEKFPCSLVAENLRQRVSLLLLSFNIFPICLPQIPASICFRSSRPGVFCEKGVLRNFAKFTGKHLCQRLFFNKVAGRGLVFSCEFCEISKNNFFYRTPPVAASICLFKCENGNSRTICEICSKLTIKNNRSYLVSLRRSAVLLTLNRFHTMFWFFHCSLWTNKWRLRSIRCNQVLFQVFSFHIDRVKSLSKN